MKENNSPNLVICHEVSLCHHDNDRYESLIDYIARVCLSLCPSVTWYWKGVRSVCCLSAIRHLSSLDTVGKSFCANKGQFYWQCCVNESPFGRDRKLDSPDSKISFFIWCHPRSHCRHKCGGWRTCMWWFFFFIVERLHDLQLFPVIFTVQKKTHPRIRHPKHLRHCTHLRSNRSRHIVIYNLPPLPRVPYPSCWLCLIWSIECNAFTIATAEVSFWPMSGDWEEGVLSIGQTLSLHRHCHVQHQKNCQIWRQGAQLQKGACSHWGPGIVKCRNGPHGKLSQ